MKRATAIPITILALAGCSASNADRPNGSSDKSNTATYSSMPSTVAAPTSAASAAPSTTARGNIPKVIGQQGGTTVSTTDSTVVFNFIVDAITPNFKCTGPYAQSPVNGQYLAVTISVTGGAGISTVGNALRVSPADFQIVGQDGVLESGIASPGTYGCVADTATYPQSGVGQGVTGKGTVVLDTKNASGFLVFSPQQVSLSNGHGWEYTF